MLKYMCRIRPSYNLHEIVKKMVYLDILICIVWFSQILIVTFSSNVICSRQYNFNIFNIYQLYNKYRCVLIF